MIFRRIPFFIISAILISCACAHARQYTDDLFGAVKRGNIKRVEEIIAENTNLDEQNNEGNTALMEVCLKGNAKIAKLLIANGADLTIKNKENATALDIAQQVRRYDLVHLLKFPQYKPQTA